MERDSILTPGEKLSDYKGLIDKLLPFALIRCTRCTNSKRVAEIIAVYTFLCAYYLAERLAGSYPVLKAVDRLVDVIGKDLTGVTRTPVNGQLLFESEDAFCAANVLAGLGMEECLSLVLYYVEKLDLEQVAVITGKSVEEMVSIIGKAQGMFIQNLATLCPGRTSLVGEIRHRMDCVTAGLDRNQFDRITATVMDYLTKQS